MPLNLLADKDSGLVSSGRILDLASFAEDVSVQRQNATALEKLWDILSCASQQKLSWSDGGIRDPDSMSCRDENERGQSCSLVFDAQSSSS